MKLTITKSELLALIQESIHSLVTDIEIVAGEFTHPHLTIWESHKNQLTGSNKIFLIKSLREQIPDLGVADAKYIIEADRPAIVRALQRFDTLVGFSSNRF